MLSTFRRLSLRHLAAHPLRTSFTILGIALGVAATVSVRLLHDSVSEAYRRTVERASGRAVLQVTNGDFGVAEELLDEVKVVPGVGAAAASVQGFLPIVDRKGERLYLFGVDLLADDELRDYGSNESEAVVEDPLVFMAQPDSVGLTTSLLERNGWKLDDRIRVRSPAGLVELTIRASLEVREGPATLFGGRVAVMDVFAAQRLFRLDRRFTQIDVGLAEGADLADVEARLRERVGARGTVARPERRGEAFDALLATNDYALTVSSMLAIVVGLYLVFNTMMIAIAQRRTEIGILRATGMRRGEVLRMVVVESLALGAIGSAVGVPIGLWMARAGAIDFASSVSNRFLPVETPTITLDAGAVALATGLGMLSSLLAAIGPAREAVRVHPLEALRSAPPVAFATGYRRGAFLGALVASAAILVWLVRRALPLGENVSGSLATLGLLIGVSLTAPAAVRRFAQRSEPVFGSLLGAVGALASRSIVANVRRVAVTCSAFLVSLAGALTMATMIASLEHTLRLWMDQVFTSDLMINSGEGSIDLDSQPFPDSLVGEIAALPGVEKVGSVRFLKVPYEGSHVVVAAGDRFSEEELPPGFQLIDGDPRKAVEISRRGAGVLVNEPFARRFDKWQGDVVTLRSPEGEVRLEVAGVYFDFQDSGEISLDREVYRRFWRDRTVSFVNVSLEPGADAERVMDEVRGRWGDTQGLFVMSMNRFRVEMDAMLEQSMAGLYGVIMVAIGIALLGVVNSLVTSVLDRTREIGVLRAVGATRRQVARAIIVEAGIIGFMGAVLAVAVGSLLGYLQLEIMVRGMLLMTVVYRYPLGVVIFSFVAAVFLAAAAGYLPGRRAARIRITEALEFE